MSGVVKTITRELTTGNVEARVGRVMDNATYWKDRSLLEAEVYIRKNPVQSVGYAAAAGFVAGVLISAILLTRSENKD
ncbi:MAG: hypothetical protein AAF984_03155 [Verrucomicrobiota bacterium]